MNTPDPIAEIIQTLATAPDSMRDELIAEIPEDLRRTIHLRTRGMAARFDNLEGFKNLYWCIYNKELPKHAIPWYNALQKAYERARAGDLTGAMIKGFRGSTKSFTVAAFVLHKLGLYPNRSNLIVQARDKDAKRTSEFLADTISKSAGWREAFPNIVADVERGWSLDGYHVKDTERDYAEFVKATMEDHGRDPSFLAVSVTGGSIGMHPTGCLMLDDIHDSFNTSSDVECEKVKERIRADIIPTMSRAGPKPLLAVTYTPWTKSDAYVMLEETGMFEVVSTPAFEYDEHGADTWGDEPVTLTWPEYFSTETLVQYRRIVGTREFKRMYLLDLSVDPSQQHYYMTFDADLLDRAWPTIGGADPSDTTKERGSDTRKQSTFALAYVSKHPQGGAVVAGGVLDQCSVAQGGLYILEAQSAFPHWLGTVVEMVGYGRMWFNQVQSTPGLRIRNGDLKGFGFSDRGQKGGKAARIANEFFPLFEDGRVKISSEPSPYLNALRKLFQEFATLDENDPAWDAGDAAYQALKGIPDVLRVVAPSDGSYASVRDRAAHRSPYQGLFGK